MEKENKEKIRGIYAAFGEYAIKFEQLIHATRYGISSLLEKHGLKNKKYASAITAKLSAMSLVELLNSLIMEDKNYDGKDLVIIRWIINNTKKSVEKRNKIIHRFWPIGYSGSDENDYGKAVGSKNIHKSSGISLALLEYEEKDFQNETRKVIAATDLVYRMCTIVNFDLEISNNFVFENESVSLSD